MSDEKPIEQLIEEVDAYCQAATPGEWAIWDSNSWRRIGTREPYADGNVICPIVQSDRQPDLLARREDLEFVINAKRDLPRLSRELRERMNNVEPDVCEFCDSPVPLDGEFCVCGPCYNKALPKARESADHAFQAVADTKPETRLLPASEMIDRDALESYARAMLYPDSRVQLLKRLAVDAGASCTWTLNADSYGETWESACGETWQFETGGPTENKMKFCCYCGKRLIENIPPNEEQL